MENKYQVIALIGESGAGKDTMQRTTCKSHPLIFHSIVSCTTRPIRENEKDGSDYHFVSLEEFTKKLLHGEMLEAAEFRNWFYGTPISSLVKDKINIGVFNIQGVKSMLADPRLDVLVVKINCDDKTRLMRCLNREPNPDCAEICRRFFTDKEDFAHISDSIDAYYVVTSYDGGCEDLICEANSLLEEIEIMWKKLETNTAFETIMRWETSMHTKADEEKIEVKDN
jgi:guanylate kinase